MLIGKITAGLYPAVIFKEYLFAKCLLICSLKSH